MKELTRAEAAAIASEYLKTIGDEFVLLDHQTMERDFGWVFFYDSEAHLRSGAIRDAVAGNAPFVVMRATGEVRVTDTVHPLDYYLEQYAAN